MITFEDMNKTKHELKDAQEVQNRLLNLKSAYDTQKNLNIKLMTSLNKLIGKYFTEPKKAYAHTYIDAQGKTTATLQISKNGIGKTSSYVTNITPFDVLINTADPDYSYQNDGLIGEVIVNKDIYNKVRSHLSTNGQYILTSLKDAYNNNKIADPEDLTFTIEIPTSKSERNILQTKKAFIGIRDNSNIPDVCIKKSKKDSSDWDNDNEIFTLNDININNEPDFVYMLYTQYHAKEIHLALDKYIEDTKERLAVWTNFNDELKEKIAKFLIVMEL